MALAEFSGTLPVTDIVANLFGSQTTLQTYATSIFFDLLEAGDAIEIIIFEKDVAAASEKVFDTFTVTGEQVALLGPDAFIPPIGTSSYRVSARRTAGSNRSITWVRKEYT